jgi:HAD superfamily hydrolase (TIGR01509 family)
MLMSLDKKFELGLQEEEVAEYVAKELGRVIATLERKAQPCVGVMEQLDALQAENKYQLAVVSSSALSRVQASIKKVGMEKYFRSDWVYSAATSLPKPTSKPDPAVYIYAMEQIGVKPEECIAVEDSKSGATAAMRAGIPLIGYVGPYDEDEKAHMVKVLTEECKADAIMYHWSEFPEILKKMDSSA